MQKKDQISRKKYISAFRGGQQTILLQTQQSSAPIRHLSQQLLYFPVYTRNFYIGITQQWIMYAVYVLKGRQLDIFISNYLYQQSISSTSDWICGCVIIIITVMRRTHNHQLLVLLPSLFNKRTDMKSEILHIRTPSIFPLFSLYNPAEQ